MEEMAWESEEDVAVRCLPAWTRRMSCVGAEVRRESRCRSVGIVVSEGMVRGIAVVVVSGCMDGWGNGRGVLSPERSLTNIWKFSDGGEDVDVEEAVEDEREGRMIGLVIEEWVWICGDVVALADGCWR